MTTNQLSKTLVAIGLALGAVSYQAAAMEEVVVYGTEATAVMPATSTLRTEMIKYVRSLNHAQKAQVNAHIAKFSEKKIQLAAAEIPTRG
jgi:hypothetical protein